MNSKPLVIFFCVIFTFMLLSLGCTEEEEAGIVGTYQRTQYEGSELYLIQIQFTEDGQLVWTPIDTFPGHTASTVNYKLVEDKRFTIYNDPDCGNEGIYSFTADNEGIFIEMIQDDCTPRQEAMSGHWGRKQG